MFIVHLLGFFFSLFGIVIGSGYNSKDFVPLTYDNVQEKYAIDNPSLSSFIVNFNDTYFVKIAYDDYTNLSYAFNPFYDYIQSNFSINWGSIISSGSNSLYIDVDSTKYSCNLYNIQ